jgi:hypothetical protein
MFYYVVKWFPRNRYLRQLHPVALWYGGINWAPYSFSYAWPGVPIAWLSWIYVRSRYLAFWSKVSSHKQYISDLPSALLTAAAVQLRAVSLLLGRHCHLWHHHALQCPVGPNRHPMVGQHAAVYRLRRNCLHNCEARCWRALLPMVESCPDPGPINICTLVCTRKLVKLFHAW